MESKRILCACYNLEHQIEFIDFKDDEAVIYLYVHLNTKGFFNRLKHGIKYILGQKSRFGAFDEFILSPEKIPELQQVLNSLKEKEAKKLQYKIFTNDN